MFAKIVVSLRLNYNNNISYHEETILDIGCLNYNN